MASLLEVLGRMPAGQELFEDLREQGREQGRHEGEVRRAREDVLEAFEARFEAVPAAVRAAVAGAEDLGLLSGWHRAVLRARDAARAAQDILATR